MSFLGFAALIVWLLPALRGKGLGYPLQVIALIWLAVYGFGSREWLLRGDTRAIGVVYAAGFAIFILCAGYMLGNRMVMLKSVTFSDGPPKVLLGSMKRRAILFASLAAIATAYFIAVGGLPAFHPNALTYRFEVRERVSSYVVFMLRASQLPLYVAWALYQLGYIRKNLKNTILIWSAIAIVMFVNFIPGWRNPLMLIALNLTFIFILSNPGRMQFRLLIIGVGSVSSILVLGFIRLYRLAQSQVVDSVNYFMQYTTDPVSLFFLWASAQFSNYTLGFITSLKVFPEVVEHLHGSVIFTTLNTILPGRQELLDEKLKRWSGMDFEGAGLNLTILGESYADFGYFGIFLYPFLYGIILGILVGRFEIFRTPSRLIMAAFAASSLSLGSLTGLLSLSNFWVLGSFLLFITLGENVAKSAHKETRGNL